MKKNKKNVIMILILFLLLSSIVIFKINTEHKVSNDSKKHSDILNKDEIEKLRKKYPLVKSDMSMMDFVDETFSQVIETSESIVDAKVVEKLPEYEIKIKASDDDYDDTVVTVCFYPYKMEIVDILTNNGIVNEDDKYFTLVISDFQLDIFPCINVGDEGIFPIFKGKGPHKDEYSFDTDTYYYVTENGYVLSAYEEEEAYVYTGVIKEKLTEDIKSINNEYCKTKLEELINISLPESTDIEQCSIDDNNVETIFYVDKSDYENLKKSIEGLQDLNNKIEFIQVDDKVKIHINDLN